MFNKTPTKGMRDFLPAEYALRQRVMSTIQAAYQKYGFCRIETPSVESLDLLTSKQGGDNEKLIFKILKRGEKLANADTDNACDLGLRYDLTIPLARYYANNAANLPAVFKAMQMDNVWRADRPQKGRFRQFVQCDIDVIGEPTILAEIDLICAVCEALENLGIEGFSIRINDRRLLFAVLKHCNFKAENFNAVLIALDKMDKIGVNGVLDEISKIEADKADLFVDLINKMCAQENSLDICEKLLHQQDVNGVVANLRKIIEVCSRQRKGGKVVFDATLVRGMDYYTGTIFEIAVDSLGLSAGGGGRYDKLIGKITGSDVPACGFSIGFERIVMLLEAKTKSNVPKPRQLVAIVIAKETDAAEFSAAFDSANHLRKSCDVTLCRKMKNFGHQLNQLRSQGVDAIYEFANNELKLVKQ